jgi:hypothetical protein
LLRRKGKLAFTLGVKYLERNGTLGHCHCHLVIVDELSAKDEAFRSKKRMQQFSLSFLFMPLQRKEGEKYISWLLSAIFTCALSPSPKAGCSTATQCHTAALSKQSKVLNLATT